MAADAAAPLPAGAGWANRLAASRGFQAFCARVPGLRRLARAEGAAIFDIMQGFVASQVLMALVDLQASIPFIIIALGVLALYGNSLTVFVALLGVFGWEAYARMVRGGALSAHAQPYVEAARTAGNSDLRLILRHILPKGTQLFTNRVANANPMTLENLRAMAPDITRAAAGLLPGFGVDAVIYGCTSGTAAIGEANVEAAVRAAQPDLPVTNPIKAVCAAFNALGGDRIAVLTPYLDEINQELAAELTKRGFTVTAIGGFDMDDDIKATMIPEEVLFEAALEADAPDAEILFISCTALRAAGLVERLEARLGKAVVTSNQALAWHVMRLMGQTLQWEGYGRLMREA